jgi:hypothetical protein
MRDDTPNFLKLTYEKWFDDHPEARAEIETTTVRQQTRPGSPKTYFKKDEFDARYWARERGPRRTG